MAPCMSFLWIHPSLSQRWHVRRASTIVRASDVVCSALSSLLRSFPFSIPLMFLKMGSRCKWSYEGLCIPGDCDFQVIFANSHFQPSQPSPTPVSSFPPFAPLRCPQPASPLSPPSHPSVRSSLILRCPGSFTASSGRCIYRPFAPPPSAGSSRLPPPPSPPPPLLPRPFLAPPPRTPGRSRAPQ